MQSRTAAGGWSQQRFARRRGKQADELVDAVVGHARRVLLGDDESPRHGSGRHTPWAGRRGRPHARARGSRRRAPLRALAGLPMRELYDLPDPKRDVLETALRRGRAVRIELTDA